MSFLSVLVLIFSPIIVALCILSPFFPNNEIKIRRVCKAFSIIHFVYSCLFIMFFNSTHLGWSYQKELTFWGTSLIKSLGITASFAIDGISLVFVVLTSFITMLVLIASKSMVRTKHRLYYPLVLFLQSVVLGVFCAKDIFLFFLFWQSELIISYLLITQWGERLFSRQAGKKYLVYSSIGNFILFLGILILYFYSFSLNGILTADIESLNIPDTFYTLGLQSFMFWCFFIGFALKLPVFPVHSGVVNSQITSLTSVSMLMAGLVISMGGYGIVRFNIGVFPEIFGLFSGFIMFIGLINIIYGAGVAFIQTNLKKVVAYLGMIQIGLILVGISSLSKIGFEGALFHMISCSLVFSGLFILLGAVYSRTKTLEKDIIGGLNKVLPICHNLGLFICLGAIAIPFSGSFISTFMIMNGLISSEMESLFLFNCAIGVCAVGLFMSIGYIVTLFHKIFYGDIMPKFKTDINEIVYPKRGITKSEIIVMSLIISSILFLGIFPNSILEIINSTSEVIIDFLKV